MRDRVARQLAADAVASLVAEVSLTPKPGLVDQASNNSHQDMDWALLVRSAKALYPTFLQIAEYAYQQPIDQKMREAIAKIGRIGERVMLQETGGINTHKGAIWTLGLMVSVLSSQERRDSHLRFNNPEDFLALCGDLATFKDRAYIAPSITKGERLRRQYQIRSAGVEAAEGFPTLRYVLAQKLHHEQDGTLKQIERLLHLIAVVDDTCVISRSDFATLTAFQALAQAVLDTGDLTSAEGVMAYQYLCDYARKHHISPGGSADLLAALIFLEKRGIL